MICVAEIAVLLALAIAMRAAVDQLTINFHLSLTFLASFIASC